MPIFPTPSAIPEAKIPEQSPAEGNLNLAFSAKW
jgi:hypothetical protein